MKARFIHKNGRQWDFPTVEEARRHIKKGGRKVETYDVVDDNGEKIRIIDFCSWGPPRGEVKDQCRNTIKRRRTTAPGM